MYGTSVYREVVGELSVYLFTRLSVFLLSCLTIGLSSGLSVSVHLSEYLAVG